MIKVQALKDGPLKVEADCEITGVDGEVITKKDASFFCRCGRSENKPFCDGQHKKVGFQG